MSSGCQSTLTTRLDKAAIAAAAAKQAPSIPDYPDKCRDHFKMPRDPMGVEQWVAWRGRVFIAAYDINSQIDSCAAWADDVKAGLSAPLKGGQP